MGLPAFLVPNSCCGCFSLRTGCYIIGALSLAGSLLQVLLISTLLVVLSDHQSGCSSADDPGHSRFAFPRLDFHDDDHDSNDRKRLMNNSNTCATDTVVLLVQTFFFLAIAIIVLFFVLTCIMIYGVKKNKPNFIKPWLIVTLISLFMTLLSLTREPAGGYGSAIGTIIIMGYSYLVVYTYVKKLLQANVQVYTTTVGPATGDAEFHFQNVELGPANYPPPPYSTSQHASLLPGQYSYSCPPPTEAYLAHGPSSMYPQLQTHYPSMESKNEIKQMV